MPGLLGEEKAFNAHYRKPVENGGDQLRAGLLHRRVKPFMLRRTKDIVAKELPPESEMAWPMELGSAQRDLYETATTLTRCLIPLSSPCHKVCLFC